MVRMTCENHRELFWICKPEAVSEQGRYTGERNIFFIGKLQPHGDVSEYNRETGEITRECDCPGFKLIAVEKVS